MSIINKETNIIFNKTDIFNKIMYILFFETIIFRNKNRNKFLKTNIFRNTFAYPPGKHYLVPSKKRREKITLKRITVDDIYQSILTQRRMTNAEGWMRMEPVDHSPRPSGSIVMDAVARLLASDCGTSAEALSLALGIEKTDLRSVFRVMTGMKPIAFLRAYRLRRAQEWLARTDLEVGEIARRCGFATHPMFHDTFVKYVGMTPGKYRRLNRPANFRELYEWEK